MQNQTARRRRKHDQPEPLERSVRLAGNAHREARLGELSLHAATALVPTASEREYRALLAAIREQGVRDPLDVTAAGLVLDGRQRLRIAAELGLERVPVRVVAPEDEVAYILLAALPRRHLTQSQRAALAVELLVNEQWREQGRARRQANLRQNTDVATLPLRDSARARAAELAGVSERLVGYALRVREADLALFEQIKCGEIPAERAARRIEQQEMRARLGATPVLPNSPADVIYADPPWQTGDPESPYAPENHYPTMPLTEIKALPVPAANDAILYLWTPNAQLPEALEVIEAWGFVFKTTIVWVKPSIVLGCWARNRHETLLVARKGNFPPAEPENRPHSVVSARRGRHSEKPAAFYELIERAHPYASKLELFARGKTRPGWQAWGNEAEQ